MINKETLEKIRQAKIAHAANEVACAADMQTYTNDLEERLLFTCSLALSMIGAGRLVEAHELLRGVK